MFVHTYYVCETRIPNLLNLRATKLNWRGSKNVILKRIEKKQLN